MSTVVEAQIEPLDIAPISGNHLSDAQLAKIDPEYAALHNRFLLGPRVQERPPKTFKRAKGSYVPGALGKVTVGSEQTVEVPRKHTQTSYPPVSIMVYTPDGTAPDGGWPIVYNIHGGGWVLGSSTSEESLNTRLCSTAKVVVVSPEYRMAPEHPYPAAIEDYCFGCGSGETLRSLSTPSACEFLSLTAQTGMLSLSVIGGASAGGHLAATMINMLTDISTAPKDLKFKLCLSIVPVTDNTAGESHLGSPTWNDYESWTTNADGPSLERSKMLWYRNLFLPNIEHRTDWHASPMLVPGTFWAAHPPTFVAVTDVDILRDEGIAYAKKLEAAGVPVQLNIYKGLPHPGILMAAALTEGRRCQEDLIEAARAALYD